MVNSPKISATAAAPPIPATGPPSTAHIAATSIIPSTPRLMMPLRCITSSPCTTRSSGVDARSASGIRSAIWSYTFESDQDENHDGLAECGQSGRDVRAPLQLSGPGSHRAEEERRGDAGERMQLRQKRDGDS